MESFLTKTCSVNKDLIPVGLDHALGPRLASQTVQSGSKIVMIKEKYSVVPTIKATETITET